MACGKYVGGAYCCAPNSKNDDGLLEVCLVRPLSHLHFVQLIGPYKRGEHLNDPRFAKHLVYRQGKEIHVEAEEGFIYSLDGEIVESNDFTIEICPKAIRFAVPTVKNPKTVSENEELTVV